jgi:hypothetical protein
MRGLQLTCSIGGSRLSGIILFGVIVGRETIVAAPTDKVVSANSVA